MAKVRIPRQKVILCGDYGVGKSSLFRRFTNDTFVTATDRQSTLGLDHIEKVYEIQDKCIKVSIFMKNFIIYYLYYAFVKCFVATIMGYGRYGASGLINLFIF